MHETGAEVDVLQTLPGNAPSACIEPLRMFASVFNREPPGA